MPTYDYECDACGHKFELFQSINDPVQRKCPECKAGAGGGCLAPGVALMFKGSGFYTTDYRDSYKKRGQGRHRLVRRLQRRQVVGQQVLGQLRRRRLGGQERSEAREEVQVVRQVTKRAASLAECGGSHVYFPVPNLPESFRPRDQPDDAVLLGPLPQDRPGKRWLKEEISIPYSEIADDGDPSRNEPLTAEN